MGNRVLWVPLHLGPLQILHHRALLHQQLSDRVAKYIQATMTVKVQQECIGQRVPSLRVVAPLRMVGYRDAKGGNRGHTMAQQVP